MAKVVGVASSRKRKRRDGPSVLVERPRLHLSGRSQKGNAHRGGMGERRVQNLTSSWIGSGYGRCLGSGLCPLRVCHLSLRDRRVSNGRSSVEILTPQTKENPSCSTPFRTPLPSFPPPLKPSLPLHYYQPPSPPPPKRPTPPLCTLAPPPPHPAHLKA